MLMLPTSLPGGIPGGMTDARPTSPRRASAAIVGMAAACSGVRQPSSAIGSSAHPSGTHTTYFTRSGYRSVAEAACRRPDEKRRSPAAVDDDVLLDRLQVVRQHVEALGTVEQVGQVRGQR